MLIVPFSILFKLLISSSADIINSIDFLILLNSNSPALFSDTPSFFLLNRVVFKSLSKTFIALLTAGCDTINSLAACVIDLFFAT